MSKREKVILAVVLVVTAVADYWEIRDVVR